MNVFCYPEICPVRGAEAISKQPKRFRVAPDWPLKGVAAFSAETSDGSYVKLVGGPG